jgi:Na+/melibiose symporter-like transporter
MLSSRTFHKQTRRPFRTLALYALPSLVTSVAALPMALFVPALYADELALPLAAVGAAIAASRLLDVIDVDTLASG